MGFSDLTGGLSLLNIVELGQLFDVSLSSPTNGQVLTYDSASGLWINADSSGGGSVQSVTGLNTDNADPANPVVKISVDGVTITGQGIPADPLVAVTGGSGTVTDVSVVSVNGFSGSVANPSTTPAISIATTVTGIIKANGSAISAAESGTDYTNMAFKTITVSGQDNVIADSAADTLTLAAGTNVTITTNGTTDTITISSSNPGGTVTTTGSPATGNLTKFSGASSITNVDLSGDVATSGSDLTTVEKIKGTTVSGTTGSTNVVFSASPTLTTPVLGVASATSVTSGAFISNNADPADAGIVRLGNAETVAWESNPTGTDITLTADSNNVITASVPINAATGFRIGNVAASGKILVGNGTNYVASTPTFPNASATSGKIIVSDGTNWIASTPTFPNSSATALKLIRSDGTNWIASTATFSDTPSTAGKMLVSDGTNWITSTPTFPNASATSGKIIISDGTNWLASTPTHPTAATSGKVIIGDGTNWVLSTPTFPNASAASGKFIQSDGTNWISSTPTLPATAGTSGKILVSDGTNFVSSTPTYPNASATSGKVIRSDGTNFASSSFTIPDTYSQGDILYASAANVLTALPAGNSGQVLATQGAAANPHWIDAAGTGTVTSVGITVPAIFTVSGTPVTTNGTFAVQAVGTSGGIPYFSNGTTLASSAALESRNIVVGGGAGATPVTSGVTIDASTNELYGYSAKVNKQVGTTYTLNATDAGKVVELNNASAITLTLPNSLATDYVVTCTQMGAGQVTVSPAAGGTLRNRSSFTKIAGQYGVITLYVTTNTTGTAATYVMAGDGA